MKNEDESDSGGNFEPRKTLQFILHEVMPSNFYEKQNGVKMMIQERFANTLPFCGVKDSHDALLVAAHTFMIDAGYKCTGIGQEVQYVEHQCTKLNCESKIFSSYTCNVS